MKIFSKRSQCWVKPNDDWIQAVAIPAYEMET